ncbi:MAG: hypothetical protein CBB97_03385 [Candidatus Endolissoclinum sp. TMED37]|nr:MAG: hypothetical protein CBB97_03385 [Candidatus Endolissoclinum sp. TMED37]
MAALLAAAATLWSAVRGHTLGAVAGLSDTPTPALTSGRLTLQSGAAAALRTITSLWTTTVQLTP